MKTVEVISYVSIAVIVVSLFFIGTELTGFALTDTGIINVTIETAASINFTVDILQLGSGVVTPGQTATVSSDQGTSPNAFWSGAAEEGQLLLENNGNSNVTIDLKATTANDAAAIFIGGTSPSFKLRVTNNETGSCVSIANFTNFDEVTTSDQEACSNLQWDDGKDLINIDAELTIPNDATPGNRQATITATATGI